MDDWQETQLTTRHVHNRVGKGSKRHGGGRSGGAFDVTRTFGTYEIKCPAADKLASRDGDQRMVSRLEMYTLNERGNAIVGELILGGVIHANVLLAGSRKTMNAVVRELEAMGRGKEEEEGEEEEEEKQEGSTGDGVEGPTEGAESGGSDGNDGNGDEGEDSMANQRVREFEKNSFRSPKFWLKWQGFLLSPAATSGPSDSEQTVTSTGYVVFSGNQCDRFQGTISCEPLEWNNVKISGWKIKSQSARDFDLTWTAD